MPPSSKSRLRVVILAGGTGTRLWPLSRESKPKQFQQLIGRTSLFQAAVKRARLVAKPADIFVATNARYVSEVRKQAPKIPTKNILSEPAFRDTATCLGYAATVLESRQPSGVMAVLYADHLIQDSKELARKLKAAVEVAASGQLAIIEVKSQYPATQLGWVKLGQPLGKTKGEAVYAFAGFKEKPNLEKALTFHRDRNYLWNTGLYVWRTDVLLEKYRQHLPVTARRLAKIGKNLNKSKVVAKEYTACEKISVDYGIMERVAKSEVAILPAHLGWSDVGTWASLKDELSRAKENLVVANHLGIETTGCLIRGNKRKLIATVGLKDIVIVDTPDALLVCAKSEVGKVKKLVERLPKRLG